MKQLLDCCGQFTVGGLNDRAFAGRLDQSHVYELLPSESAAPVDTAKDQPTNAIQAVGIRRLNNDDVYCAVARHDKSLSLYRLELVAEAGADNEQHQETHGRKSTRLQPTITYRTTKRVTSLCFASVASKDSKEKDLAVIIAADLAGDAVAFAVENVDPAYVSSDNDDNDDESSKSSRFRRLLLGHTASMLTSVCVASHGTSQHILTGDRDEKVRVSSFPNSHIIEGYLLGHEAFVSSVDVARENGKARCVSCSGDGSVRMWDYQTMEELGQHILTGKEAGCDALIPTKVAMNGRGTIVVVCVDELEAMTVLRWKEDGKTFEPTDSVKLSGQALAAVWMDHETFLVLTSGPQVFRCYRLSDPEGAGVGVIESELAWLLEMNQVARDDHISLPTSILERDEYGVLKMQKQEEKRIQNADRAWNDASRVETAKERDRRYKKRKKNREVAASESDGS